MKSKTFVVMSYHDAKRLLLASFSSLQEALEYVRDNANKCPLQIATIDNDDILMVNYIDGKIFVC